MEQTDRPGKEIPKEYRPIVVELIDNQGWRYDKNKGGKHPHLWPADKTKAMIPVVGTPGDVRSLRNFTAQVRRAGGLWPVPKEKGQ